jgi:hypothetical protein
MVRVLRTMAGTESLGTAGDMEEESALHTFCGLPKDSTSSLLLREAASS